MHVWRSVDKFRRRECLGAKHFDSRRRGNACSSRVRRPPVIAVVVAQALALLLTRSTAYGAADLDWSRLGSESAELLSSLVRIDTSNPPGNETPAAQLLADRLRADGIAAEVIESSPGRGNLHARLPGHGSGRPIVLLSHLDVVPASPSDWSVPPFSGLRERGRVYGRGTLDAKGIATVQAMTLIALKRGGIVLDRDVVLLATADEEAGGAAGARWIVEHRPELVAGTEFLVNEGDHIHERPGRGRLVHIAVAEKAPFWVKLSARGQSGHASTPPGETAVTRLVRALVRLVQHATAVHVTPAVRDYFAALAPYEAQPLRARLEDLSTAVSDPAFLADFASNARQNALIRNTITPTVLAAGTRTNVIPAEAIAQIDCRLLPGQDPTAFLAELRAAVDDPDVTIEPMLSFPTTSSPADSALVTAIRAMAVADLDGAPVVPSVIPGFTDSHWFRSLGIASYGFVPFVLREDDQRTVHGADEHVSEENLALGVRLMTSLLRRLH
jgi:acetylornithine deacetylase/succinyl-diaminopimelate desuccinylase-like protein